MLSLKLSGSLRVLNAYTLRRCGGSSGSSSGSSSSSSGSGSSSSSSSSNDSSGSSSSSSSGSGSGSGSGSSSSSGSGSSSSSSSSSNNSSSSSSSSSSSNLYELLSSLPSNNTIIMGDFNLKVNQHISSSISLTDMVASSNFIQHITTPTHSSGNTLDLVISSSKSNLIIQIKPITHLLTDHFTI